MAFYWEFEDFGETGSDGGPAFAWLRRGRQNIEDDDEDEDDYDSPLPKLALRLVKNGVPEIAE